MRSMSVWRRKRTSAAAVEAATRTAATAKERKIRTPAAAATANAIVREIDREGRFTVPF